MLVDQRRTLSLQSFYGAHPVSLKRRRYAGFGTGTAGELFPGVVFANVGAFTLVTGGSPPSGQWAGYVSPGPFPANLQSNVSDALIDAQTTSSPDRQNLAASFISSAKDLVSRLDAGLSFNNALGIGDSSLQQAQQWASNINTLMSKSRTFVSQYNALPAAAPLPAGMVNSTVPGAPPVATGSSGAMLPAASGHDWTKILMIAVPAVLVLGGGAFWLLKKKRRSSVSGYRRRIRR